MRARRERRFGIRARMFVAALLLASAALLSAGLVAGPAIDAWLVDDAQRQLEDIARVAAAALSAPSPSGLEARASAVAQASGARLTLVAADRSVRVDTGGEDILSPAAVEVTAALSGGIGRARRPAALTGDETLFVAVPWAGAGDAGALRAARAVAVVDAAQAALRRLLLVAATVGLAMAGLIGLVAALSFARWLGSLVARVRAAIASAHGAEAPESVRVEGLAGSVGRLARELERSVSHLAQERQRQEAVLDALDEAVVALGPDGRLTMANAAASALLELPHDAIGRPLVELVRTPPLVELVRRATAGAPETISCRLIGARQRDVAAHAAPLAAPGGVVLALRDVTELRRLEGIRRDFVANVSHEMRTPITVIRANAETLLDGALEDPQAARTFTDAIGRHAQRLDTLVSDLLELARIEAGRLDLELLPLSVPDLVRRVVEAHAPMAERRDHQVTVDVPEGLRLVGHASSLERVLANLLQNAINYTPPGGHISIRASIEGEHVRLEVADDGPGIPLRHRARIFERFYRVDPGRSREMGGTGLGLAIVKHLVSAMSGTVGVRSAERSHPTRPGAVFWCDLPRA
ncbi:MAG: PAS domain-containing protein [Deltaproteobacteria bacterium]|nr:PAS domain-containing protein [Deltaproteobacteria bacterium]MCB9785229.1 PAS domain-containing protein [Deltaproteobacteria bacterium]